MTITDMVLSYEDTMKYKIQDHYLPKEIQETPFVWVPIFDHKTEKTIPMLYGRNYAEKLKPSDGYYPALGFYELFYLRSMLHDEDIILGSKYIRDDVFLKEIKIIGLESYMNIAETAKQKSREEHLQSTPRVARVLDRFSTDNTHWGTSSNDEPMEENGISR